MYYGSAAHAAQVALGRDPEIADGLQWLTFAHLPEALQRFSRPFYAAAVELVQTVATDSPELKTSVKKLIEAKDSAVRAGIRHDTGRAGSVPRPQEVSEPPQLRPACDAHTPDGPCTLGAGHPVGPMYPGHNGHMVTE